MHILLKGVAEPLAPNQWYEKVVTQRAVAARRHQLRDKSHEPQLSGPLETSPQVLALGLQAHLIGKILKMPSGQEFSAGDLVFLGADLSRCFLISACFQREAPGLVLEALVCAGEVTPACSLWKREVQASFLTILVGGPQFVQHASYWPLEGEIIEVLHPVWWG